MRRRMFAPLFAGILLAALATPLMAHMKLEKSEPAADSAAKITVKQVQLWFSEAPDPTVSKLEMSGPNGPIKLTGVHVMARKALMGTIEGKLTEGTYTVHWQAAGEDGHVQKGEYSFTVAAK